MPTSDEIVIREYKDGDEVQINLLHNQEYGTDRSLEAWQWEFRDLPYSEFILVVAEFKGKIIGTQALLPVHLSWRGQKLLGARSEETLVDKEFRGQGIFKRLYDKCFDLATQKGIVLIWGFTKQVNAFARCGFNVLGKLSYVVLILDPAQTYQINKSGIPAEVKRRLPIRAGQMLLLRAFTLAGFLWFKTKGYKTEPHPDFQIVSITQADDRLDAFWRSFSQEKKFNTIARTSDYLDWRIFRNPNVTSQFLAAVKDKQIQGYVIISKSKYENVGRITDFCVLDEHFDEIAGLLMTHAIESFRSQRVAYVEAKYASNNLEAKKYSSWLRRFGFISLPVGSAIVLKVLAEERDFPGKPTDLDQWFITSLFGEGVG